MQSHTAPVDREAATQIENGCYPEPEKLLGSAIGDVPESSEHPSSFPRPESAGMPDMPQ
jgi:hypothetical protein